MTEYLTYNFEDSPGFVDTFDELPLWSASFGLLLFKYLALQPNLTVLDIGSGAGFPVLELAGRLGPSCRLYGLDPWENANQRANKKIKNYGLTNVQMIAGSADQIPFDDHSIDLIVSNLGINNFDQPNLVFRECHRVLRPAGRLVLTTNLNGHWQEFYDIFAATLQSVKRKMKIMKQYASLLALLILLCSACLQKHLPVEASAYSGNPVFPGWYADPEGIIFDQEYWIYPTYSDDYEHPDRSTEFSAQQLAAQKNTINQQYLKQTFINAFSSRDLITWTKHPHVLDIKDVKWAAYSIWAPAILRANHKYYLFFSANDIQSDAEHGGIGVAVADNPAGPFVDAIGKPLINEFHHGAQPIDQSVFVDDDGQIYMYYGGWGHCNVVKLSKDLLRTELFADGERFKEITPAHYVEGPFVFKRKNKYYFMWSEGGWTGPDYSVAYAIGDSPLGPFKRISKILQQDSTIATGAGHHSVITIPNTDERYIVYHRRPLNTSNAHHRETCIDRMTFDQQGYINPVKMTSTGVQKRLLKTSK